MNEPNPREVLHDTYVRYKKSRLPVDKYVSERDAYLRERGIRGWQGGQRRSQAYIGPILHRLWRPVAPGCPNGAVPYHWAIDVAAIGGRMEDSVDLLKAVAAELEETKQILQTLSNEIIATHNGVNPQLLAMAKEIRSARMTAVSEIQQSLSALRDLRRFFLEADYAAEMQRLERFVVLCRELQALKAAGVLDAVSDTMLRLAGAGNSEVNR